MSCETCSSLRMFSVMYLYNLVHHHLCFYRISGLRVWRVGTPFYLHWNLWNRGFFGHGCCILHLRSFLFLIRMVRRLVMDSSSHEETETGLRGFRKRWREAVSIASVANPEARVSEVDGADAISLDLEPDAADSPFGSNFGSEDYVPSIQPEASQSSGSVQVAATGSSEFGWRCKALKSAVKRTRLYGDTFAWEQPGFGGVFKDQTPLLGQ